MKTYKYKLLIVALLAMNCMVASGSAEAQLKAANGATGISSAPNGVPVVNIANPNSAGLSNNLFTDYNVASQGLILNNQNSSKQSATSQLGGSVFANPNLGSGQEANVILNQVVSTNRSTLAGYTEVVGGNADVVVANPNGITCSGCGFINTSHATLTTGTPVITSGALTGFNVATGDILITGNGLDASTTDYVALFARSLAIQGQINAQALDIVAGANAIDYATKAVNAQTATGTVPTLAIDSSALGGMYAGRIRLIATEAGVGVRMLGDASAGAGDFTLTANGKIDLESHVSTQGNLQVTSTDSSNADSIKAADANLDSQGDTTLTALNGNIHLIGGLLDSQGNLTLQSTSLTDTADAGSVLINNQNYNNVRYAVDFLTLTQSGATTLNGTIFGAGKGLGITAGSLAIGANSETLYGETLQITATGNMSLAAAALQATGDLSLTSTAGNISTAAASGEAIESTGGNIAFSAATGINNAGAVSADTGSLTVKTSSTLANSGALYANTTATFADQANANSENIDNSGTIIAGDSLNVTAAALTNENGAGIKGTNGSTFALSSLDNYGTLVSSANSGYSGTINTGTFINESTGVIQSAGNLTLAATGAGANYNNIVAVGTLSLSAAALVNNANSTIQAGTGSTFSLSSLDNFGTVTGSTGGSGSTTVNTGTLTNESTGVIQAAADLTLAATGAVANYNNIIDGGNLSFSATTLTNTANSTIQGGASSSFTVATLDNYGTVTGSANGGTGATTITANTLTNENTGVIQSAPITGGIQSAQDLALNVRDNFTNDNNILATGDMTLDAVTTATTLTMANSNSATMQAGGALTINGTHSTNFGLVTQSGNLLGNSVNITAPTLTNNGTIQAAQDVTLNFTNFTVNNDTILAGGNLSLTATRLNNNGGGIVQAGTGSTFTLGVLDNYGTITGSTIGADTATLNIGMITNESTGIIQSTGGLTISSSNTVSNGHYILAGGNLSLSAAALTNGGGDVIQGGTGSTFNLTSLDNSGTVTGSTVVGDSATINADMLTNETGGLIQSAQDLTLNVKNTLTNNHDIVANRHLTINARDSSDTLALVNSNTSSVLQAGPVWIVDGGTSGILTIGDTTGNNKVTLGTQNGDLIGYGLSLNLLSLTNNGAIQGGEYEVNANGQLSGSNITVQNALTNNAYANNAGGLINISGPAAISASTVTNSGVMQSGFDITINASNTLTNTSTGIIQSPTSSVILNVGQNLTNNNDILAYGDVSIAASSTATLAVTNALGAIMQSSVEDVGATGFNGGNNVTFTQNGKVFGAGLDFNVLTLTNSGTMQGGNDQSNITATTLTNNSGATISLADSSRQGTITTSSLTNNGTLQSNGSMDLELGTSTLNITSSNKIVAAENMTINAGTITFGNSTSAIIAGLSSNSTGTINLSGDLINTGFLFSDGTLNLTAAHILNTPTGAIAANGTVNITSSGLSDKSSLTCSGGPITLGSIINCGGALYAGSALNVNTRISTSSSQGGASGTFVNEAGGTVNSSGDINFKTGNFTNYNNINATHNIDVSTGNCCSTGTYGMFVNTNSGTTSANIIAGGNLTIENFYTAGNVGSNLAASSTLTIQNGEVSFDNTAVNGITSGVYAGTLVVNGTFALNNTVRQNDSKSLSVSSTAASGTVGSDALTVSNTATNGVSSASGALATSGTGAINAASGVNGASSINGTGAINASATVTLGGIHITLPTNPNGEFITNPNPKTGPLIETNPMYAVGSSFLGSNYMEQQYGVNPDTLERSLGDANYEASLIQQQIVGAGAAALLGNQNQAAAMQQLMTNGDTVGKSLGLTIGVAPTAAQLASLSSNMVWMVDTVVDGQHVLAPVVYLSAATKSQIASGAVIQATNVNMNVDSVNNNGGTINATDNMNLTAFSNITNTSGNITAANMNLTTIGGDIINQTSATTIGTLGNQSTVIGATGVISATGNLSLNAANNITNLGANMSAGNNASLVAGNNITFGTIQDLTSSTSTSHSGGLFGSSNTQTVNTTVTNIGSNLTVGGNLTSNSGKDTTIQGSTVNVTGNGAMTTGGNLNILDAQNTSYTSTSTAKSGFGVGGGLAGSQNTTDTDLKGTSVASNVTFGGNATLNASNSVTVQGSNLSTTKGDLSLNAQSVNVLAGRNTDLHTTTTDTTTLFSTSGGNSSSGNSDANTTYTPTAQQTGMGQTQTNAAGANAGAGEKATATGVNLLNHTTTSTVDSSSTAVGSTIHSGGNLTVNSTGDTTLEGATVSAGGNANLNAGGNLNVLAAQNTHSVTTSTDSQSLGLYASTQNNATSGANTGYADTGTGATSNTTGTATAGGQAASNNNVNLVDVNNTGKTTTDVTHTGTTITSGGNTSLGATNDINIAGSSVNATGNLSTTAGGNLNVTAVQDSHTVTTNSSDTSAGLYADGTANASGSGSGDSGAKYGGLGMQGTGTASANANAGIGLQGSNTTTSSTTGSTTAVTSSLTSGGDMTRTAGGTITDQGTAINAGGNLTQSAASWVNTAAQNTTFSTTGSATNTAQLGLYAGANGGATGNYNQNTTTVTQDPSASVGVSANYQQNTSGSSSATSTAVASNVHAGGNFTSTTTGATSLQGTKISTGGDATLNASSLNYTAAQNTSSSSTSTGNINASLQAGEGTSGYTGALSGGANQMGTTNASTTAVVGSITSGGNLNVNTTGDQTYEGTNLTAGKDAAIASSGGNVTFNAAQNTSSSSENYQGFTASISGNEKGGNLGFDGGTNGQNSSSTTAVTSNVSAGGGLTIKANNDLTMQGTNLTSGGDTTLAANTLNYEAAQNTSSSSQASQTLNVAAGGKSDGSAAAFTGAYVNTDTSNSSTTAVVGNLKSGGNLNITTTGDQTYTGTNITAGGDANVNSTSGAVNFNQAQNTSNSSSTQWGVSASASTQQGKDGGTTQKGAAQGGYQTNTSATTTGVASNIKTGGTLDVTSSKDLTLQGTNITTGGDTSLQSTGGNVNYQATTSTATGSGWGIDAQVAGSDSSSGTSPSGTKQGQLGANYSSQNDTTQTAGSIKSGGAVAIKGNQDVTLTGTNVTSTGNTTVAATNGNVNINAATSTKDDQGYAAALGVKNTTGGSGATATSKNTYSGGVDVAVTESTTRTGSTINAGSVNVMSGKDANLTGTNIQTTGDTNLNAGGNLNLMAAQSTNGGVNLNVTVLQSKNLPMGKGATGGIPLIQNAGVNGGSTSTGVNIASGGNLSTASGGTTTMQATQANVTGTANIDAAGGVNKTSTMSGGVDLGFKLSKDPTGTASAEVPTTSDTAINAKGGTTTSTAKPAASTAAPSLSVQQTKTIATDLTTNVTTASPKLQSSLTNILNNANLSTTDKFSKMTAAINSDTTLSAADKSTMLASLAAQQKNLTSGGGAQTSP